MILGTFIAGAVVSLADRDQVMTHPDFRRKLEAIGFGVFIPIFFVTSGVRFDLDALVADPSNVAMVPIFLAALLLVRGVPALLYRRLLDGRAHAGRRDPPGNLAAVHRRRNAIGLELGLIDAAEGAALVGAGLLSVLVFPVARAGAAAPRPRMRPSTAPEPPRWPATSNTARPPADQATTH